MNKVINTYKKDGVDYGSPFVWTPAQMQAAGWNTNIDGPLKFSIEGEPYQLVGYGTVGGANIGVGKSLDGNYEAVYQPLPEVTVTASPGKSLKTANGDYANTSADYYKWRVGTQFANNVNKASLGMMAYGAAPIAISAAPLSSTLNLFKPFIPDILSGIQIGTGADLAMRLGSGRTYGEWGQYYLSPYLKKYMSPETANIVSDLAGESLNPGGWFGSYKNLRTPVYSVVNAYNKYSPIAKYIWNMAPGKIESSVGGNIAKLSNRKLKNIGTGMYFDGISRRAMYDNDMIDWPALYGRFNSRWLQQKDTHKINFEDNSTLGYAGYGPGSDAMFPQYNKPGTRMNYINNGESGITIRRRHSSGGDYDEVELDGFRPNSKDKVEDLFLGYNPNQGKILIKGNFANEGTFVNDVLRNGFGYQQLGQSNNWSLFLKRKGVTGTPTETIGYLDNPSDPINSKVWYANAKVPAKKVLNYLNNRNVVPNNFNRDLSYADKLMFGDRDKRIADSLFVDYKRAKQLADAYDSKLYNDPIDYIKKLQDDGTLQHGADTRTTGMAILQMIKSKKWNYPKVHYYTEYPAESYQESDFNLLKDVSGFYDPDDDTLYTGLNENMDPDVVAAHETEHSYQRNVPYISSQKELLHKVYQTGHSIGTTTSDDVMEKGATNAEFRRTFYKQLSDRIKESGGKIDPRQSYTTTRYAITNADPERLLHLYNVAKDTNGKYYVDNSKITSQYMYDYAKDLVRRLNKGETTVEEFIPLFKRALYGAPMLLAPYMFVGNKQYVKNKK